MNKHIFCNFLKTRSCVVYYYTIVSIRATVINVIALEEINVPSEGFEGPSKIKSLFVV